MTWNGDRRVIIVVEGDDKTTDVRITQLRDTPMGVPDLELTKDYSLLGDPEAEPSKWLRDLLVNMAEHL